MRQHAHIRDSLKRVLIPILVVAYGSGTYADDSVTHFRFESGDARSGGFQRAIGIRLARNSPGVLDEPNSVENRSSWRFDGRTAIAYGPPSNTEGFSHDFTWEGFFLSPKTNVYQNETGIADRLISQFAFDKGNWTRLAIGLVGDRNSKPRLSIELEGFDGRSFGQGKQIVTPDRWHHFAMVHEGTESAGVIRWYLDYELCGEVFLGGQSNQNTLRPPGAASFTIGGRLAQNDSVNRGFDGYIDEVRLSPQVLSVSSFLRTKEPFSALATESDALSQAPQNEFWTARHLWAEQQSSGWAQLEGADRPIDALIHDIQRGISDSSFLRRLSLHVRGRIPSLDEVKSFLSDSRPDKRTRIIDRYLASPEWADAWVGYWQDVLAENPSVVFPTLNNSGAFRQWIYESFRENKPFDRFATELMLMDGSVTEDGPAGFSLATGNDSPMAMRAHVLMKAFAAVDLKCARCHDSPVDDFRQEDLFRLATALNDGPLSVPATSVAAVGITNDQSLIRSSLSAGQTLQPEKLKAHWLAEARVRSELMALQPGRNRAELAALITSPHNSRFSDVIVNRVWKRFFGEALIEPVDNWNSLPGRPDSMLLRVLSSRLVRNGYDLKSLARIILNSEAWQSEHGNGRRMSAEQLVDSLFIAVGKQFQGEVLGVHATDPGAMQLPRPERTWQFAALPNERDRPALAMPVNQTIVDVMTAYGWNGSRQQPRTDRENITSPLQPLIMFNGLLSQRIVRLSDRSGITELCLQAESVETLVEQLFLTFLSRGSTDDERERFVFLLKAGFEDRVTGKPRRPVSALSSFQPDWRKHLEPEQSRLMLEARAKVALGERPTECLKSDFRERVEDAVWALINSPEFVVIP